MIASRQSSVQMVCFKVMGADLISVRKYEFQLKYVSIDHMVDGLGLIQRYNVIVWFKRS